MKGWQKPLGILLAALLLNLIFVFLPQAQNNNSGQSGTTFTTPKATIKHWHQTK